MQQYPQSSREPLLPREDAIAAARRDFSGALGKQMYITELMGYDARSNPHEFNFELPVLVRVIETADADVAHFNDEWLDPYWNIVPVEERAELAGLANFWCFGPSYMTKEE